MLYNPEKEIDIQRAKIKFLQLINSKKTFELKEIKPKRTLKQNKYLHLILSWFALEYGETLKYVKEEMFKKQINKDIFQVEYTNRLTGEIRIDYKSTASLDTKELTIAIDRFRNYSSKEAGIYLPEPKDRAYLEEIEIQTTNNKHYL